ncbi:type II toxin-antitoxin system RelE/ParE family toxin [Stratiformator vulcanicus]|uniref:Plasmid stabilization system protein n=1 Tax=Stratiformator vulcanicus TaxID=2527980 RepID=A0A517QXU0_9PLAN|nr:type II toxin-antitoxin system RelE/ParE family toxin [Stratiformator vulcanicus]QDT36423.1 Plasmid stabilization system protein [Stratiformator vulcanicus]
MRYRVKLSQRAERQLLEAVEWYEVNAPQFSESWYRSILQSIATLETDPHRLPHAREDHHLQMELRELHFGYRKRMTHRILFVVRDDEVLIRSI